MTQPDHLADAPDFLCSMCAHPFAPDEDGGCAQCGQRPALSAGLMKPPGLLSLPPMRYQNHYTWLVLVSALDIILTMLVLFVWGGHEVNPIARAVIVDRGFIWAIAFKFGTMLLAVLACEIVGRKDNRRGERLATVLVAINAMPVAYTFALLLTDGRVAA